MNYTCDFCGYVYDESLGDIESGIVANTPWPDVPADWTCPVCGVSKEYFSDN